MICLVKIGDVVVVIVWYLDLPTTCAINTYHHWSFELESCLATTLCDSLLVSDRWFSPGIPVSFTNKTDHCDITEIGLKVELNTINLTLLNYMAL